MQRSEKRGRGEPARLQRDAHRQRRHGEVDLGAAYKGPVLSVQLFGRANARISSDIDILIDARDFRAAAAVLSEHGYQRGGYAVDDDVYFARWKDVPFNNQRTQSSVELQWRALPRGASCGFETETSKLKTTSLQSDPSIVSIADEDLFVLLAHHGLEHRWESLKWIADIDAFCRRSNVAWDAVAAKARATCSWNIVALSVHLAAHLLHTPIPELFRSVHPRVPRTAARFAMAMRHQTPVGDLESFWIQFTLRERWRDRIDFLRFVCTPKPRDISEGRFLGLPGFMQPLLRPLRLMVEDHKGHKRVVSDVQKIVEWDA